MHPVKIIWAVRAVLYKFFLKEVGLPTYIGKPVFIEGRRGISIGKRVRIFPGIRMEAIGSGSISIGNNVAIEQNVHIISSDIDLPIGNNVTIAPNVFISNANHSYEQVGKSVMEQKNTIARTAIGDNCFIGFGVVVQAGTVLGNNCIVGANAVVKGEYPDNSVIVGVPGKIIKRYDQEQKVWIRCR